MAKGTFIVYDEIKDSLDEMTDEEIGRLFRGMVDYHVTGEEPELEGGLKFAFIPIRQQMDRDDEKWAKTREARSEAGKKSAEAKAQQSSTNSTKVDFVEQINKSQQIQLLMSMSMKMLMLMLMIMLLTNRLIRRMTK